MKEVKREPKIKIKQNWLDRAIATVAPVTGVKRYKARAQLAIAESYTGASKRKNSLRNFFGTSSDADTDLQFERATLIERSRDLVRNDPIAGGAKTTECMNVVGTGIRPHPSIDYEVLGMTEEDADRWEKATKREFSLWADTPECDIEATQNFFQKQNLIYGQVFENGDVFILPVRKESQRIPYGLKLQVIEADRVCNENSRINGILDGGNRLYDGVEKDKNGSPLRYHICNLHPGSYVFGQDKKWNKIDAFGQHTGLRNVIHLYEMVRPGQSRGIPRLAPVIEPLKQLNRFTEAHLVKAIVQNIFTVFIKTAHADDDDDTFKNVRTITGTNRETGEPGSDYELGNGTILELADNEDIVTANASAPDSNYDPFVVSIFKQIGVGLGIPFEILMKYYTSSYTAARAAILDAWRFFKTRRRWLADNFCQVIYEIWMYEAVALGRIYAPGFFTDPILRKAYLGCEWVGPAQGQVNPLHEISAAEKRIQIGISTVQRETIEYSGEDFEKNKPVIRRERAFFSELNGGNNETD